MPSVVILSGNHLCHNPRVFKEASALARAGYSVEVMGAWLVASLKYQDQELMKQIQFRYSPTVDFTRSDVVARLKKQVYRFRKKASQLAYRFPGMETRYQLGAVVDALGRAALDSKADLFIAHSEPALAVAQDLLSAGKRVGVDMEDWFSEDLLPETKKNRPLRLLRDLERTLLCKSSHSTCPSRAMSEALLNEFGCLRPEVIYNAFPWSDRKSIDGQMRDRRDSSIPSIHWYSQTIGPGRGLEDLFAALPFLNKKVEVHLRGNPVSSFDDWINAHVSSDVKDCIILHGLVSNEELLSRIAEHDIGFAGETKYCRSRDLTVTNKILHYLIAGLVVIASDTAGQKEVAEKAEGGVRIYPSGNPEELAELINELLESQERLKSTKSAALSAAEQTFCWERQEQVLIESVESALRNQPRLARYEKIC